MNFVKLNELQTYIETDILNALTGQNDNVLNVTESFAIAEITGYISGKYNTDEMFAKKDEKRNNYLIALVIDIMIFQLYSRTTSNNIPEIRTSKYAKAIEYLENVAKGKITPDFPLKDNKFDRGSSQMLYGSNIKINNTTL